MTGKGNFDTLPVGVDRWSVDAGGPEVCCVARLSFRSFEGLNNAVSPLFAGVLVLLRAWRLIKLGIVGVVMVLAACATAPREHSADAYAGMSLEAQVKERATKRWEALIRADLNTAYGYFSRATRDTFSIELYRAKMRPGIWREAKVQSVKCADGVCEVVVILTIDHLRLKGAIAPVTERWIVQDGLAWYVYNG